jgi:hypothetical protein
VVVKKAEEFWVTNISGTQDLSISDLRVTIRCGQSINLFARGKNGKSLYNFTREDIENSRRSGSLFKKQNWLKIREVAPVVFNHRIDIANSAYRSSTRLNRKASDIEVPDYPDLDFDDDESLEKFAEQNADMDFEDRRPTLAVDPKYKKATVDE